MFETEMEKAVDQLLDSHGYTGVTMIRPVAEGVEVRTERAVVRDDGAWLLVAVVTPMGQIINKTGVPW